MHVCTFPMLYWSSGWCSYKKLPKPNAICPQCKTDALGNLRGPGHTPASNMSATPRLYMWRQKSSTHVSIFAALVLLSCSGRTLCSSWHGGRVLSHPEHLKQITVRELASPLLEAVLPLACVLELFLEVLFSAFMAACWSLSLLIDSIKVSRGGFKSTTATELPGMLAAATRAVGI